jgi:HSP20 family molecular chaperone IbpA
MNSRVYVCLVALLLAAGAAEAYWYGPPPGAPWYGPPAYPAPGYGHRVPQSVRIATDRSPEGYVVTISLTGYQPSDIEVVRAGRWLIVRRAASEAESERQPGAYRFHRSYSTFSRRVTLPRDADLEAMQRTDGEGFIRLTVPRQAH